MLPSVLSNAEFSAKLSTYKRNPPMRCKVQLYVAGKVFDEIVEARNYDDAKRTAIARNPSAKIIGVTAVFR
jgi:hypothetical protein